MSDSSPSPEEEPMAGYSQGVFGVRQTIPSEPTYHPIVEGQFDDLDSDEEDDEVQFESAMENIGLGSSRPRQEVVESEALNGAEGEEETTVVVNDLEFDYDDDDDDYDDDEFQMWDEKSGPNCQSKKANQKFLQTSDELFRKFSSKINVEKYECVDNLPSGAGNKILSASKRANAQRIKVKDKQDRATVEQVLDPRTRMILYKLLSSGKIVTIDGCISTGKEANVYHATGPDNTALAIKIFKTSILHFKARDKYVSGEFRFRQGYCKKNPRKMVRVWAEKEFRNLLRIHACGTIKVPHPKILKSHVLVMDFIGEDGWPCPLLKDVKFGEMNLGEDEVEQTDDNAIGNSQNPAILHLIEDLYRQCLVILYRLFKHCKLVHADFSEFNLILKDDKELYVIDVSQSVEHDHPRSLDFLRHDIKNVQEFFGKHIRVGDYIEIFEFITSPNVDDSNYESVLGDIIKNAKPWEAFNVTDEVFRQTHIPRKMQEVVNYERDYEKMKKGETELVYTKIMGMKSDMSGPEVLTLPNGNCTDSGPPMNKDLAETSKNVDDKENVSEGSEDISASSGDSENEAEDEDNENKGAPIRPKDETAEEKKARKKQVKEDKAEKRKTKVKKHIKKRKEKLAHANSKR